MLCLAGHRVGVVNAGGLGLGLYGDVNAVVLVLLHAVLCSVGVGGVVYLELVGKASVGLGESVGGAKLEAARAYGKA